MDGLSDSPDCDYFNSLDLHMSAGRDALVSEANAYASSNADSEAKRIQLTSQFLKSNTGKMFERFVGVSITQVSK